MMSVNGGLSFILKFSKWHLNLLQKEFTQIKIDFIFTRNLTKGFVHEHRKHHKIFEEEKLFI